MQPDLDVRQLRALVAVLDHGGITRAARALGLSQSTVSEAVAALERALGTAVLVRGARGPTLTAAGEALLPRARHILAALDDARAAVADTAAQARSVVTVGTNESVSAYVLPPVVAELRREHPGARFQISTMACAEARAAVAQGRVELGLLLEGEEDDGAEVSVPLAAGRLVFFAGPGHPAAGRPLDAAALAPHDVYLSDAAGSFHGLVRRWLERDGFPSDRLLSTGSVEGVKGAVRADRSAVGVLPAHALGPELRAGDVVELHPRPALPRVWLRALWRRGTEPSVRARELMERLRGAQLAGE